MVLPALVLLKVMVEGTRPIWSYQTAIAGVREATRYLGRVVPSDICPDPMSAVMASLRLPALVMITVGRVVI